jgi:hypothetical protein
LRLVERVLSYSTQFDQVLGLAVSYFSFQDWLVGRQFHNGQRNSLIYGGGS